MFSALACKIDFAAERAVFGFILASFMVSYIKEELGNMFIKHN